MSKSRTWILSIALALGLASLAGAQQPTSAYVPAHSYVPVTSYVPANGLVPAGHRVVYQGAPQHGSAFNGPVHNGLGHNGPAHNGGSCANGACAKGTGCPSHGICPKRDCPPAHKHCMEGAPRIRFRRGCPSPVCPPCDAPNWGYFQPCWNPWPWPPDWSHCPVMPPAATVVPGPLVDAAPASEFLVPLPPPVRKLQPGL